MSDALPTRHVGKQIKMQPHEVTANSKRYRHRQRLRRRGYLHAGHWQSLRCRIHTFGIPHKSNRWLHHNY